MYTSNESQMWTFWIKCWATFWHLPVVVFIEHLWGHLSLSQAVWRVIEAEHGSSFNPTEELQLVLQVCERVFHLWAVRMQVWSRMSRMHGTCRVLTKSHVVSYGMLSLVLVSAA